MNLRLIGVCLNLLFICSCFSSNKEKISEKEMQVVFRQIGNKLLWSVGDSTSKILPIEKKGDNVYLITFGKQINIISDSLYKIVTQELARVGKYDFIAELKDCDSGRVQLSLLYYSAKDSITPCLRREVSTGCYVLEISLQEKVTEWRSEWIWLLLIIPLMSIVYFLWKKKKKDIKAPDNTDLIQLGTYQYNEKERMLYHSNQRIALTEKEAQLLFVLFNGINQIQNRDFLMEELWGRHGLVVVPKNLDVLVSKLRKKLLLDENIKIINTHATGYKLKIC